MSSLRNSCPEIASVRHERTWQFSGQARGRRRHAVRVDDHDRHSLPTTPTWPRRQAARAPAEHPQGCRRSRARDRPCVSPSAHRQGALWDWRFNFQIHWAEHVSGKREECTQRRRHDGAGREQLHVRGGHVDAGAVGRAFNAGTFGRAGSDGASQDVAFAEAPPSRADHSVGSESRIATLSP